MAYKIIGNVGIFLVANVVNCCYRAGSVDIVDFLEALAVKKARITKDSPRQNHHIINI